MINKLKNKVKQQSIHSKDKSDEHGEVFTSENLINQMLDSLPKDSFKDKTKKWLDPCSGKGNFPVIILERLMIGLEDEIENEEEKYKYIMENMIYMCEYQKESAETINNIFNENNDIKLNLYYGDTLTMPEDFFNLSYEERFEKYPNNCIGNIVKQEILKEKIVEEKPVFKQEIKKINNKDSWMENILNKAKEINKRKLKN